jgi:hypothetical protein
MQQRRERGAVFGSDTSEGDIRQRELDAERVQRGLDMLERDAESHRGGDHALLQHSTDANRVVEAVDRRISTQ